MVGHCLAQVLFTDSAYVPLGHFLEQFQVELSAKYSTGPSGHLYTH